MSQHEVLVFLVTLASLLAIARLFGALARRVGLPSVAGELSAGLLLGRTGLARLAPRAHAWLFPGGAPEHMLAGYAMVAAVLLLAATGLEIDLRVVRRRGSRTALATTALGFMVPFVCGVGLALATLHAGLTAAAHPIHFAVFLGAALSISALPVIAKTLFDLGLFKTDIGLLVMTAAMLSDLAGWLTFSILVGPMEHLALAIGGTLALVALVVFAGQRLVDRILARPDQPGPPASGRVLSLFVLLALIGASVAQAMGVHAVLGGFVTGVMLGASSALPERLRVMIEDFVMNVFAPVFFAWVGLHVDLVYAFDPWLVGLVLVVATAAKVGGCTIGALIGGLRWREASAVGVGLNARGAMGVIVAALGLKVGLIGERLFVALAVMAVVTSVASGPLMRRILYREEPEEDVVALLRRGAFVARLHAPSSTEAIAELVRALGSLLAGKKRSARDRVVDRELVAATGLGDEVAIPHAAVEGLERPLLALGRAPYGIDFDAPDGKPAKIVFLLLIPPKAYEEEVRILASIARATFDERARRELLAAEGLEEVMRALAENARRVKESSRPAAAGLAGM